MSEVQISRDGAVQIVRIDRPEKKNSITGAMYQVLIAALTEGASNPDIAVTLFLGQPGIFSAGNDISDFVAASAGGNFENHAFNFLYALVDCPTPLIAAVDGPAVGIGTTLMMHCDFVLASPRAAFLTPFVNLGLVPEAASSLIGPRLMGHARAFELLVMGETFSAEQAREAGLVNRIVPPEELEAAALKVAKTLSAKPREAVRISRQLLKGDPAEIKKRMKDEVALFMERLKSAEAMAAFQAFLQKAPRTAE